MGARTINRNIIILASVPLLLVALVFGCNAAVQYKYRRARTNWKTATLRRLAGTPIPNEQILTEIDQIKYATRDMNPGWAHEHVILMTNGEYLVYAWWHGANSGFIDHLFLARGTDGKWYYSTYHFCNSMASIVGEDPAGSISEFVKRYSVRQFDGKSDECLKHTWPAKR